MIRSLRACRSPARRLAHTSSSPSYTERPPPTNKISRKSAGQSGSNATSLTTRRGLAPRIITQRTQQKSARTSSLGYTKRPPSVNNRPDDSAGRYDADAASRIVPTPLSLAPNIITQKSVQEFVPSEIVEAFADKYNLQFPNKLQLLKGPRRGQFPVRVSTCRRHVFSPYHLKYLTIFDHALRDKILHLYQEKSSTPLWLYVHGLVQDGSPAVVRTTSERMARKAFHSALAAAGYQKSGRSVKLKDQCLHGTIRLLIMSPKEFLKLSYEDVVECFTELLVGQAVWRLACDSRLIGVSHSAPTTAHGVGRSEP
ncbi:hypothetical protein MFIFM68171_02416 [Madurella fahalii]|uniref:Uncharacterized protein n=1 Tax=Madurella fahalii TaxID=1157608 RepID=A0ABQ0G393_9PEZI